MISNLHFCYDPEKKAVILNFSTSSVTFGDRASRGSLLVGCFHASCFPDYPKAFPFQEQPFRDATRKATILQKVGACASEAKGMRETWQGGPLAVDEVEMKFKIQNDLLLS